MTAWFALLQSLRSLKRADARRPGVPGEHWGTFAAAMGALQAARSVRSPLLRTAALVVGGVLVVRAISGRDGPLAKLRARR